MGERRTFNELSGLVRPARASVLERLDSDGERWRHELDGLPEKHGREAGLTIEGKANLLRIFVGENDAWGDGPLYKEVVRLARDRRLAGATVVRGIEGFGRSSTVHTAPFLRPSELPLMIEIVDTPEKIASFVEEVAPMIESGMVSIENVEVRAHRRRERAGDPSGEET